jgi:hypothetical protein
MLSIGLWRWYINITITILDIIHRIVFYLKHGVRRLDSVSVFRWNLLSWIKQQELVPVPGLLQQHISHWWYMLCWLYKPLLVLVVVSRDKNSSFYWAHISRFRLKAETGSSVVTSCFIYRTGQWIMCGIVEADLPDDGSNLERSCGRCWSKPMLMYKYSIGSFFEFVSSIFPPKMWPSFEIFQVKKRQNRTFNTVAIGSAQPLTEISSRNFAMSKVAACA